MITGVSQRAEKTGIKGKKIIKRVKTVSREDSQGELRKSTAAMVHRVGLGKQKGIKLSYRSPLAKKRQNKKEKRGREKRKP